MYNSNNVIYETIDVIVRPAKTVYIKANLKPYYSKSEVDTLLSDKLVKVTNETDFEQAYIKDATGGQTMIDVMTRPYSNTIMKRDEYGGCAIGTLGDNDQYASEFDVVNRGYVKQIADSKVPIIDSIESYNRVYVAPRGSGKQQPIGIVATDALESGTIVRRDSGGSFKVSDPVDDKDVANLGYIKKIANDKVDKLQPSTYSPKVYLMMEDGTPGSKFLRIPADANSIPQRTDTGAVNVGTPTYDTHATTKKYVDDRFNGANKSLAYANYQDMINDLSMTGQHSLAYRVGQNIYIQTLNVPDLWISEFRDSGPGYAYDYTTDEAILSDLEILGYIRVGYYTLSVLETQKVDLTDYAKAKDVRDAVSGKLDKVSTPTRYDQLYMKDMLGGNYMADVSTFADAGTIAMRGADGVLPVGSPKSDFDAVNLEYFNAKVPKLSLTLKENGAYTLSITTPEAEV